MSYEPTVWQTGDTVTAEKLNKLENQVEKVSKICNITMASDLAGTLLLCVIVCKENTESGPKLVELSDREAGMLLANSRVVVQSVNLDILDDMPLAYTGGKIYLAFPEGTFNYIVKINGEAVTIDDLESSSFKSGGNWISNYLYCYEITDDTIVSISYVD